MTRKDYILMAKAFKDEWIEIAPVPETLNHREGARRMVVALSHRLQSDNPRFDRLRFLTACGIDVNVSESERATECLNCGDDPDPCEECGKGVTENV